MENKDYLDQIMKDGVERAGRLSYGPLEEYTKRLAMSLAKRDQDTQPG